MNVLFVCRANSGRSQIAMELYNLLHPAEAESAGTMVETPGQHLKDRPTAQIGISIMKEIGIDMSENIRTQVTPEMLSQYEKVVVLAEPEVIPSYMHTAPNVLFRYIEDIRYKNRLEAWRICKDILQVVLEVSNQMHPVRRKVPAAH